MSGLGLFDQTALIRGTLILAEEEQFITDLCEDAWCDERRAVSGALTSVDVRDLILARATFLRVAFPDRFEQLDEVGL